MEREGKIFHVENIVSLRATVSRQIVSQVWQLHWAAPRNPWKKKKSGFPHRVRPLRTKRRSVGTEFRR